MMGDRVEARPVMSVPRPSTAPNALADWMRAGLLTSLLQDALADTDLLLDDGGSLAVTEDVEFGLKQVTQEPAERASKGLDEWDLPPLHSADATSQALRRWLLDATQVSSRQVFLSPLPEMRAHFQAFDLELGHIKPA